MKKQNHELSAGWLNEGTDSLAVEHSSGKLFKMRWPLNIDVVDGFCFEKDYRGAYGDPECRPAPPN